MEMEEHISISMKSQDGRTSVVRGHVLHVVRCTCVPSRGEAGAGHEEQLLVRDARVALLLPVHGAAGAPIVVHLCWRQLRRQGSLPHFGCVQLQLRDECAMRTGD